MGETIESKAAAAGGEIRSASVSFQLPANALVVKQWNQVETKSSTRVVLRLDRTGLSVEISPGLFVDVQWPLSNVKWTGLKYEFGVKGVPVMTVAPRPGLFLPPTPRLVSGLPGQVTQVDLEDTQSIALGGTGVVKSRIVAMFNDMVGATRFSAPGYDPLTDPDPGRTLAQLQQKFLATPSSSPLTTKDLTGMSGTVTVVPKSPISRSTADGGVEIVGGSPITISAKLQGTAADVVNKSIRVDTVAISGDGIYLLKNGQREVQLTRLEIARGCQVTVSEFKAIGKTIKTAEGAETFLRFVGLLLHTAAAVQGNSAATEAILKHRIEQGEANPTIVQGVATGQMEAALSSAIKELYRQNYNQLSTRMPAGINLDDVFGESCRK